MRIKEKNTRIKKKNARIKEKKKNTQFSYAKNFFATLIRTIFLFFLLILKML